VSGTEVLSHSRAEAPDAMASSGPPAPAVRRWLLLVWVAILIMVAIGGITRLTGSGLSIVEWKPLMGAIPPLSEQDWHEVFAKYQASPSTCRRTTG
jgi:heme a synthase